MVSPWNKDGGHVLSTTQMPEQVFGFIYLITTSDGRKYIGKKQIFSKRKRKFGKREIAKMENKRLKKWEYVIKENDWKTYTGSNDELNKLIEEGIKYKKEIIYYAENKGQLTYLELRELWSHRVLESSVFFNSNISGKHFNQYKKQEK
jgi:predicted GIY-YIG superfamily endonuclease